MAKNDEESKENQKYEENENKYLNNLDQWILSRLSWMVDSVNSAFAERNFHKAIAAIRQFLHYEFCDFYVVKYNTIFYEIYKLKNIDHYNNSDNVVCILINFNLIIPLFKKII